MKKFISILAVVSFFVGVIFVNVCFSDENQARANLQGYLNNLSNKPLFANLRIIQAPVLFSMSQGDNKEVLFRAEQGKRYVIFASGDNNTFDIDMYLYDASGAMIARDDLTPVIRGAAGTDAGLVTVPFFTQMIKARIHLYTGDGHVAYAIGTY